MVIVVNLNILVSGIDIKAVMTVTSCSSGVVKARQSCDSRVKI